VRLRLLQRQRDLVAQPIEDNKKRSRIAHR
jgi:hypothetical protein